MNHLHYAPLSDVQNQYGDLLNTHWTSKLLSAEFDYFLCSVCRAHIQSHCLEKKKKDSIEKVKLKSKLNNVFKRLFKMTHNYHITFYTNICYLYPNIGTY